MLMKLTKGVFKENIKIGLRNRRIIQCPALNWITLGQTKSDNINQIILLTEETFCKIT
jgi:hypothetical protein